MPELGQRARPRFVVYLLQNDKSVPPIAEVIDLPLLGVQVPNPNESLIESEGRLCRCFLVPFLDCRIVCWEQELESPQRFLDKKRRVQ